MKKSISFPFAALTALLLTACSGQAKLTEISLPDAPLALDVGETAALTVSYVYDGETPESAQPEITYTSGDEAVATVDAQGTVTGVAEGETTITVTVDDLTAAQAVIVTVPVESISVEDMSLNLADGAADVACTVAPDNFSGELTYTIADEAVAKYENGQLVPVADGSTILTVTAPNGVTTTADVEVWSGPKSITVTAAQTEITKGKGVQLTAADEMGGELAAETLTWNSSDESVAVVTNGWVDVCGVGTATITASNGHGVQGEIALTGIAPAAASNHASGNSTAGADSSSDTDTSTAVSETYGGASAPASSGEGHGYFTVYGDGTAFDLQNQIRAAAGVGALTWDNGLGDIAAARCQQIATDFSHNGAQTAENIAWGPADSSSVIAGWQNSPGHYANMINAGYTSGAIVHMYDGDGCNFWVAVFR